MMPSVQSTTGSVTVKGAKLYYDVAGSGHPLVLIHGGLVDRRLWDDQFAAFAQHYRVIRYDVRGYGESQTTDNTSYSHHQDLHDLLQALGVDKTYVVGLSMGGGIALEFALAYPTMVAALVLVGAGLEGTEPPAEEQQLGKGIGAAYERGDKAKAVELSLQMWTDGRGRTPEQVDPAVRERVRAMTAQIFALPDDEATVEPLEPPALERLQDIRVPTLVLIGDHDLQTIFATADLVEARVPDTRRVLLPNAAHHPNMERPAEFNQAVLDFLVEL